MSVPFLIIEHNNTSYGGDTWDYVDSADTIEETTKKCVDYIEEDDVILYVYKLVRSVQIERKPDITEYEVIAPNSTVKKVKEPEQEI